MVVAMTRVVELGARVTGSVMVVILLVVDPGRVAVMVVGDSVTVRMVEDSETVNVVAERVTVTVVLVSLTGTVTVVTMLLVGRGGGL